PVWLPEADGPRDLGDPLGRQLGPPVGELVVAGGDLFGGHAHGLPAPSAARFSAMNGTVGTIRSVKKTSVSARCPTHSIVLHLPGMGRASTCSGVIPATADRRSSIPRS